MSAKLTTTTDQTDLEDTASLPVADLAADAADAADAAVPVQPVVPVSASELGDRLREVEQRLDQKAERVTDLEAQVEQADQHLTALQNQLIESRARQVELEAQLQEARAHAQAQSQLVVERRTAVVRHHEQDFSDLRNRTERQLEALTTWQGFRAVSDAMLEDAEARNAQLETKVSSLTDSVRVLEERRARSTPQSQSEVLRSEVKALQSQITSLRAELVAARIGQSQSKPATDVKVSPASTRNAPDVSDGPVNATVVMYGDQWEYKEEPGDSPTGEMQQLPAPVAEAPVRALVRQDEAGDLIYPIGRRTTIGRTADNNVQIDAPNVSRHHAVLLVSAELCHVEDLNSTNGVMVNGCRVTRQELQDGDIVTIGKTEFRFMQRS